MIFVDTHCTSLEILIIFEFMLHYGGVRYLFFKFGCGDEISRVSSLINTLLSILCRDKISRY